MAEAFSPRLEFAARLKWGEAAWMAVAAGTAAGIALAGPRGALVATAAIAVFLISLRRVDIGIGLLAGVFERAPLRITVRGAGGVDAAKVKKLIEAAQGQFDLAPGRLTAGTKAV